MTITTNPNEQKKIEEMREKLNQLDFVNFMKVNSQVAGANVKIGEQVGDDRGVLGNKFGDELELEKLDQEIEANKTFGDLVQAQTPVQDSKQITSKDIEELNKKMAEAEYKKKIDAMGQDEKDKLTVKFKNPFTSD
jgi:hypothetical protein